jgi:predicted ATPase
VKYYDVKDHQDLKAILKRDFESWNEKHSSISSSDQFSCQYYDMYKNRTKQFDEFKSLVKSLGLVDDIIVHEPKEEDTLIKSGYLFFPLFFINKNFFYFRDLSDGTQRVIALLIHLFNDNSSLMLIEEPESSIHHGLLVKLLSIFSQYSNNRKFLISTHSEQILNELEPDQIIYLFLKNGNTEVKYVNGRNLKIVRKYLNEVGPLGEYYSSGELEGDIEN